MYPYDNQPFNPVQIPTPADAWKLNPYYLTPSYAAPFRPDYDGYQGFNNTYAYQPGMRGAYSNISPLSFDKDPYYSSINNLTDRNFSELSYGIGDKVASGFGSYAAPLAAAVVANKVFMSRVQSYNRGSAAWAMFNGGNVREAMGGTSSYAYNLGSKFGKGFVQGGANMFERFGPDAMIKNQKGLRSAAYLAARRSTVRLGGTIGGVMGFGMLPMMAAEMGMDAFETFALDPYVETRKTQNTLKEHFQNTYFGGLSGTPVTGFGLSGRQAGNLAYGIQGAGIRDIRFDGRGSEYSDMTRFAGENGLFSNVYSGSHDEIIRKVKSAADQALLVMRVAKEPSLQSAVKLIGDLMRMGADPMTGATSRALGSLGASSAIAGTSVYHTMNTVGQQGQYMFQSAGLMPYVGQMTAAASKASLTAAFRTGLVSPGIMAMMGGVDGATQNAVQGIIQGTSSPYNQMRLANRYMFGSPQIGLGNNLAAFGANFAKDPVNTMGLMMLNQGMMQSHDIARNGGASVLIQARDLAERMGLIRNGSMGAGVAAQILSSMGLSPDKIQAVLEEARANQDPKTRNLQVGAMTAYGKDQYMQFLNQEGLSGFGRYFAPIKRGYRNVIEWGSRGARSLPAFLGGASDTMSEAFLRLQYPHLKENAALKEFGLMGSVAPGGGEEEMVPYTPGRTLWNNPFKSTWARFKQMITSSQGGGAIATAAGGGDGLDSPLLDEEDKLLLKSLRGEVSGYRVTQRAKGRGSAEFTDYVNTLAAKSLSGADETTAQAIRSARALTKVGQSKDKREELMGHLRRIARIAGKSEWVDDADNLLEHNFSDSWQRSIVVPTTVGGEATSKLFSGLKNLAPGAFEQNAKGFLGYSQALGLAKQIVANGGGLEGGSWLAGEGKGAVSDLGKALGLGSNADPEVVYEKARKLMVLAARTDTGNADVILKGGRKSGESEQDYIRRKISEGGRVGLTLGGPGNGLPAGADDETALRYMNQVVGPDSASRQRLAAGFQAGQIDFQGYITSEAALDFKQAVGEFSEAVRTFKGNPQVASAAVVAPEYPGARTNLVQKRIG